MIVILLTVFLVAGCGPAATSVPPTETPLPTATPTPLPSATPVPLSAEEILAKSQEASNALKTFHMVMDMQIAAQGQTLQMTMDGVTENPDKAQFRMGLLGESIEAIMLGDDALYVRESTASPWIKTGADQLGTSFGSQLDVMDTALSPRRGDDAQIDGVAAYVLSFDIDKAPTLALAISPDDTTLATADVFGVTHLWDMADTDTPLASLPGLSQEDIMTIAFSPDGKHLATGGADAVINVWTLQPASDD